jgi:hypothetical protein
MLGPLLRIEPPSANPSLFDLPAVAADQQLSLPHASASSPSFFRRVETCSGPMTHPLNPDDQPARKISLGNKTHKRSPSGGLGEVNKDPSTLMRIPYQHSMSVMPEVWSSRRPEQKEGFYPLIQVTDYRCESLFSRFPHVRTSKL